MVVRLSAPNSLARTRSVVSGRVLASARAYCRSYPRGTCFGCATTGTSQTPPRAKKTARWVTVGRMPGRVLQSAQGRPQTQQGPLCSGFERHLRHRRAGRAEHPLLQVRLAGRRCSPRCSGYGGCVVSVDSCAVGIVVSSTCLPSRRLSTQLDLPCMLRELNKVGGRYLPTCDCGCHYCACRTQASCTHTSVPSSVRCYIYLPVPDVLCA